MGLRISVDYAAMEEAGTVIRNSSKSIEEKLSELDSQLKKIDWDGADEQAYNAHRAKWNQAIADMNQILHQISGAVDTARQGYTDTEQAGTSAWA